MLIHIHIYIHIYIYLYICMFIHVYIHVYVYVCVYMYIYIDSPLTTMFAFLVVGIQSYGNVGIPQNRV
jgi:hypothetical protein